MKRILMAFLVLTSISVAAQDAVLLRVNYHEGDAYLLKVESNSDMGISGYMNSTMMMSMNVVTVEDGIFKTESKLTSVDLDMEQGGMSVTYNTTMKAEDLDQIGQMMKSQFDPMMGATIYTSFDNLGTTLSTTIEPAIDGLEQLSQNAGSMNYPVETVSVGSTWSAEQERNGMIMKMMYTVRSIADGMIVLDITGDMTGVGTGTIKGSTNIDLKSGVQSTSELVLSISTQGVDVMTTVKTTMSKV